MIDLGAAASNINAKRVSPAEEIRRLDPVISALAADGVLISVDSFIPQVQLFAIERNVAFLNDILGFADAAIYSELAVADCRLVVMHAAQARGRAQRVELSADQVWDRMARFFSERLAALECGGIARERLILDPGMGFFLSTRTEASLRVLVGLGQLKREFGLPVMVSVSRKSFLRALTGRTAASETGAATLAAELYAVAAGADFIRTHDPAALRDGLEVISALHATESDLDSHL